MINVGFLGGRRHIGLDRRLFNNNPKCSKQMNVGEFSIRDKFADLPLAPVELL